MITTTQSAIAADFDAFSETTWFTAAFLVYISLYMARSKSTNLAQISASSLTPLSGRLSQIFTPPNFLMFSSIVMGIGLFVTASAPTVGAFITGRAITGCGCGGIMSTTIILILALSTKKRRGLFLGVISAMLTSGIAIGAVLGGAMTPRFGWVSMPMAGVTAEKRS
jgi:MFS family permease